MKRHLLPGVIAFAALAALGAVVAFASTTNTTLSSGNSIHLFCNGTQLTTTRLNSREALVTCNGATPTPAKTSTPTATPAVPATATPTKPPAATPTNSPAATASTTPTATATPTQPAGSGLVATLGGCQVFPANNAWNQDVSGLPVDANSANYLVAIAAQGGNQFLHADFGSDPTYGIPYIVVPAGQPMVPITFTAYGDESDPGPYPVPQNAPVEGGPNSTGDRHVIVVQQGACKDYELYNAYPNGTGWNADAGAVWTLNSNALRPFGWTSADAAGLPILPGLAKFDEIAAGPITHALRFTVSKTQKGYILPATHYASSSTATNLLPMGARLRLKASFDTSKFTGEARVILDGLKKYGMIVADNGSNWYISGATDPRWNDNDLNQLKTVPGSAFEVVQTGPINH
ncbi:MAG: hypothetical protein ACHP7E_09425 [Burkholderiales bacterium]